MLQNLWQTYKPLFLTQAAEHFKGLSTIWQGEPEIEAVGCNPGRLHRRGLLGAGLGRLRKSSLGGDDGKGVLSRGSNDRYQLFHSTPHPPQLPSDRFWGAGNNIFQSPLLASF